MFDVMINLRMGYTEMVGGSVGMCILAEKVHDLVAIYRDLKIHAFLPHEWDDSPHVLAAWVDQFLHPRGLFIDIGYSWGFGYGVVEDMRHLEKLNDMSMRHHVAVSIDGIYRSRWQPTWMSRVLPLNFKSLSDSQLISLPSLVDSAYRCYQTRDKRLRGHALDGPPGVVRDDFSLEVDADHGGIDNAKVTHLWAINVITREINAWNGSQKTARRGLSDLLSL